MTDRRTAPRPNLSRRGFLGLVGAAAAAPVLAPRRRTYCFFWERPRITVAKNAAISVLGRGSGLPFPDIVATPDGMILRREGPYLMWRVEVAGTGTTDPARARYEVPLTPIELAERETLRLAQRLGRRAGKTDMIHARIKAAAEGPRRA